MRHSEDYRGHWRVSLRAGTMGATLPCPCVYLLRTADILNKMGKRRNAWPPPEALDCPTAAKSQDNFFYFIQMARTWKFCPSDLVHLSWSPFYQRIKLAFGGRYILSDKKKKKSNSGVGDEVDKIYLDVVTHRFVLNLIARHGCWSL